MPDKQKLISGSALTVDVNVISASALGVNAYFISACSECQRLLCWRCDSCPTQAYGNPHGIAVGAACTVACKSSHEGIVETP